VSGGGREPGALGEEAAWALVRAVSEAAGAKRVKGASVHRTQAVTAGDLQVAPDGSWSHPGPVSDAGRDIFDIFLPLAVRPAFVVGQLGQSLDGRIATETGASHYVTGPDDIRRLHRLRALVDAVVVGAGTVAADDPRLTLREVEGENTDRVVIDPEARLDPQRRVFMDGVARTVLVRRAPPEISRVRALGDEIAVPSVGDGLLDLGQLVVALAEQGLTRVLVEGGGITVSRFLAAGALDRLHVTVAPMLIGSGRPSLTLDPIRSLNDALRPPARTFRLGSDVLFDLDVSRPGR
jgi:riboflavin-specific deaminase-like protein